MPYIISASSVERQKTSTLSADAVASASFVHRAARSALHDLVVVHPACVHAGAAEQNASPADENALQHAFDVVIAIGCLLAPATADHCIAQQEDGHFGFGILLEQHMGEPEGIVASFSAIGRVIENEEYLNGWLLPIS